jgi:hypothetical protein
MINHLTDLKKGKTPVSKSRAALLALVLLVEEALL